ncbi:MAG: aldolase [Symploca sp. SIO1C4]|uniref:Aldolase n=1 Tax=Symploca sp. SIO1C4 TaxID=2607765 RepID=A0A6B3ND17_9CYAN|nr:aldolase [Symploca sp. SIO1C4]
MSKVFDFSRPLEPFEAVVSFLNQTNLDLFQSLPKIIQNNAKLYGFCFESTAKVIEDSNKYSLKHLIVVTDESDAYIATEKHKSWLKHYDTITLAICYSERQHYTQAGKTIDKLKKSYGDKINYLRPTYNNKLGMWTPCTQKLADNSICDSVRIKYRSQKVDIDISEVIHVYASFFELCSDVFREYRLWHRSPTDGFFAIRIGKSDKFLITSTKTNKVNLDLDRIALIHSYDELNNIITYSGLFIPSSDSVEAAIVLNAIPSISALVHTHASKLFTRNPLYQNKVKVPPMSYGEIKLGKALVKELKNIQLDDFLIMADHGELFFNSSKSDLKQHSQVVSDFCESSLNLIQNNS